MDKKYLPVVQRATPAYRMGIGELVVQEHQNGSFVVTANVVTRAEQGTQQGSFLLVRHGVRRLKVKSHVVGDIVLGRCVG